MVTHAAGGPVRARLGFLAAAVLFTGLAGCSSGSPNSSVPSTTGPPSSKSMPAASPLASSSSTSGRTRSSSAAAASSAPPSVGPAKPSPAETALVTVAGCLRGKGFTVGPAQTVDDRVQALSDLAQRTARQARTDSATLYFATTDSASGAALLRETLTVPNDPYRLRIAGKAVLMYRPSTSATAIADVRSCLRP